MGLFLETLLFATILFNLPFTVILRKRGSVFGIHGMISKIYLCPQWVFARFVYVVLSTEMTKICKERKISNKEDKCKIEFQS